MSKCKLLVLTDEFWRECGGLPGFEKSASEESRILASYMNAGKLVPTDLVNKTVRKFIHSDECKEGCILDGYPVGTLL